MVIFKGHFMKKMTYHITLRFISITLISLILITTGVQISSMLKINSDIVKIQRLWDDVQVEQSEKLRLENAIHSFLGFGGMIHKLKDLILTDNITQLESIKTDIQSVQTIIQLYLSFQLSKAERYALNDISRVLEKYQANSNKVFSLVQQKISQQKLDQFMHIDDKPALQGLEVLKQYNRKLHNDHLSYIDYDHDDHHPDKFMVLTDLVAQLGYSGLVHHIKNFQLRESGNYAIATQQSIAQVKKTLNLYSQLPLSTDEQKAIKSILHTADFYQIILKTLKQPINEREAVLFVALKGIDKATTKAVQVLQQHIDIELQNNISAIGENIHSIHLTINNSVKLIIVISLISLIFFSYIMFHKVITPLQKVTLAMVSLARHGHQKESHFTTPHIFEIKQMIRSIRIFKKNENKRRNIAKSLTQMNKTTLQQLAEITALQNKSEQKTEQALSLANHLIDLQKSADIDRNNALDSQRRVSMILNTVHDAIITTNSDGVIESINTATELMLGYRKPELLGKNITQLMSEEMAIRHQQILQDLKSPNPPNIPKSSREQELKRANGTTFPVEVFMGKSKFNNEITYTAVIRDITKRKKNEKAIQQLVLSDPLTNLANRRHFNQYLQHSMESAKRLNLSVGLLMIDLDNFKPVNDTYGHGIGDKVLQLVSRRLNNITRHVDLTARLGGDEFAIILNNSNDKFDPIIPAQKAIDSISEAMEIDGNKIYIGATIGISISPKDAQGLEALINHADKALYKAKKLGKGQYFLYQNLSNSEKSL